MKLPERILAGDRLALARLLTQLENEAPEGQKTLGALYVHTGDAYRIGVTGAPGTGKSTLVNQLARQLREQPLPGHAEVPQVAIIAVDPTSPFSGGAILGDRIRMRDLSGDQGIFIRSMASRGSLGGLAKTTGSLALALDAAGFEIILIETVGAGQAEVEVASTAHTTIVIDAPGMGDEVQANKAGILEIADILVVNKADQPGAENTVRVLEMALEYAQNQDPSAEKNWHPPVLATTASTGEGIAALVESVYAHFDHLDESGLWVDRERQQISSQLEASLRQELFERFRRGSGDEAIVKAVEALLAREITPLEAIEKLLGSADQRPNS
jgi:LAO/AO transport system kinase